MYPSLWAPACAQSITGQKGLFSVWTQDWVSCSANNTEVISGGPGWWWWWWWWCCLPSNNILSHSCGRGLAGPMGGERDCHMDLTSLHPGCWIMRAGTWFRCWRQSSHLNVSNRTEVVSFGGIFWGEVLPGSIRYTMRQRTGDVFCRRLPDKWISSQVRYAPKTPPTHQQRTCIDQTLSESASPLWWP